MARVAKDKVFVMVAALAVAVDLTAEEFRDMQERKEMSGPAHKLGLPREALVKREFIAGDECSGSVGGRNVVIQSGKKIKDARLALTLIEQDCPVIVREHLDLQPNMILPSAIGQALADFDEVEVEEVDAKALLEQLEDENKDDPDVAHAKAALENLAAAPPPKAKTAKEKAAEKAAK